MINSIRILVCAITIGFAACAVQAQVPPPAPINQIFTDPELARIVADYLQRPIGDVVTQEDLAKVTYLKNYSYYFNPNIAQLTGIGYLRNLKDINLTGMMEGDSILVLPPEMFQLHELVYISASTTIRSRSYLRKSAISVN